MAPGSYGSALHSKAEAICAALIDGYTTAGGGIRAKLPLEEEEEATTSCRSAGGCQFGVVHVKSVDEAGHDRMVQMKVRRFLLGYLCMLLG